MGCSKNYIMYWGGYVYYNITGMKKSVHKDAIISSVFVVKIDKGRGFIEKTYPFYQKHSVIILLGALIPVPVHGKGGKEGH